MKNKKVIFIIFLIVIVIILGYVMHNIFYEKKDNNIEIEKTSEEILEDTYAQVQDKNIYNLKEDESIFIDEMIIDNKEIENGYEIYVKPVFVKEVSLENDNFFELYRDYNVETNMLENKIIDVDKQDYLLAIQDDTIDGVNNINLIGLVGENELQTYKYIYKYDEKEKTYKFIEFVKVENEI